MRDLWIEIRRRPDLDLVTAIEILSPTNKTGRGILAVSSQAAKLDPPERSSGRARFAGAWSAAADGPRAAARRFLRFHLPSRSPAEVRRLRLVDSQPLPNIPIPLLTRSRRHSGSCPPSSPLATNAAVTPGHSIMPHPWICPWPLPIVTGLRSTSAVRGPEDCLVLDSRSRIGFNAGGSGVHCEESSSHAGRLSSTPNPISSSGAYRMSRTRPAAPAWSPELARKPRWVYRLLGLALLTLSMPTNPVSAAEPPTGSAKLTVHADREGPKVSPLLYGHLLRGHQLLGRRRNLRRAGAQPLVRGLGQAGSLDGHQGGESKVEVADRHLRPASARRTSGRSRSPSPTSDGSAGIDNEGFWGIPVKQGEVYRLSLRAPCDRRASRGTDDRSRRQQSTLLREGASCPGVDPGLEDL